MNMKNKTLLGIILALLVAIIGAIAGPAARGAYADGANTVLVILAAMSMRTLGLLLTCLVLKKPLFQTRGQILIAMRSGFFQFLSNATILASLVFLPAPVAIVITYTHALMLLFFMAWRKEVKLDLNTFLTTFVALIGITLVLNFWEQKSTNSLIGIILAFVSAIAAMSRAYLYGRQTKTHHPAVVGAETFIFALFFAFMVPIFKAPVLPATLHGYYWVALSATSMAVSTVLLFYAISMIGAFQTSLFMKIEPVFVALFSYFLVGEKLQLSQYFGIVVVILSLVAYQYFNSRNKAPS